MKFKALKLPFMQRKMSPHTMIILSELGKRLVSGGEEAGGLNYRILSELEAHDGSRTLMQLAKDLNMRDLDDLRYRVKTLKAAGFVRIAGEDSTYPMGEED